MKLLVGTLAALALWSVTACGVPLQNEPEPLPTLQVSTGR